MIYCLTYSLSTQVSANLRQRIFNNRLVAGVNPVLTGTGIILCMRSANEIWRYAVKPFLIGWAQTQNDRCRYNLARRLCFSVRYIS